MCLRDVSFRHAGSPTPVFSGLTAQLGPGQAVALCGANGAGKSTLLELLLGLRRPSAGAVTLGGVPLHRLGWRARSRRFGYLPQRADLLLHAPTVAEELALALRWRGWAPQATAERVKEWLERLGLAAAAERFPHLLSRGERQRLALGAILIAGPDVLVLDEPFVGQDADQAARLLALCRTFLGEHADRSLLVATHDLDPWGTAFPIRWQLEQGRLAVMGAVAAPGEVPLRRLAGGTR
jgi:energy-coupling factor transporter ATP-binding protein EcfA2